MLAELNHLKAQPNLKIKLHKFHMTVCYLTTEQAIPFSRPDCALFQLPYYRH